MILFSSRDPPFSGDKQVARRSRSAYFGKEKFFVHFLHYDVHRWHAGDINPTDVDADRYIRVPDKIAPDPNNPYDTIWETDGSTHVFDKKNMTIFDLGASFFNI